MESYGCKSTPMAFGEVYTGLQQEPSMRENPLSISLQQRLKSTNSYSKHQSCIWIVMHVMSGSTWNKLTPEQQEIVRKQQLKQGNIKIV